jgi:hypothetical protein
MSDDFEQRLRSGAEQFAADLKPGSADRIRARGDQRRRRKIAGSVALALVLVAGGGGSAYAIGRQHHSAPPAVSPLAPTATPAPSATPGHGTTPPAGPTGSARPGRGSSGPGRSGPGGPGSAGTTTLRLGPLILRVPDTWRITYHDARGDYTVSTGACASDELLGAEGGSACPAFSLISGAGPTSAGAPGTHSYVPGQFYTTSTGATGCPARPTTAGWFREVPARPYSSGYAPVTAARTADYTVWQVGCLLDDRPPAALSFQQRDWYLPDSDLLIVDEYSIPGLAQILAAGTWAG